MIHPAYAAGMFDGEGTCGLYAQANGYVQMKLSVASQNMEVLKLLSEQWNGRIDLHGRVYKWELIRNNERLSFLLAVRQYLIIKAELADLLLEFLERPVRRGVKHTPAQRVELLTYITRCQEIKQRAKWEDKAPSTDSKGGE
jgi:hypothetical protein